VRKYGTTLDHNHDTMGTRLNHLMEELADGLQYAIWIKQAIDEQREKAYKQAMQDLINHAKTSLYSVGTITVNDLRTSADLLTKKFV
jgi:hypothetical protein